MNKPRIILPLERGTACDHGVSRCVDHAYKLGTEDKEQFKFYPSFLSMKILLIPLFLFTSFVMGKPTESREWVSSAGTKVTGSALSISAGKVTLKVDTRTIIVPLDKLSKEDQEFLKEHFGAELVEGMDPVAGRGGKYITDGLSQKIGQVLGPIDAGEGSTYYLYIPTTLREGRLAPLLHYNGSGGGKEGSVKKHIEGAELNGWIVAASVESKNGPLHPVGNHAHAKRCVEHLIETLPVDAKRVYFTGGSGGGAMTFYNAAKLKSAGGMPHIGYIPNEVTVKGGDFFVISGTTDYNRYHSALAVKKIGETAIHRFFPGAHQEGPDWLCIEGMIWLNGRYLAKNKRSQGIAAEALDYEASMIAWIRKLSTTSEHRAYYWCTFLKDDYGIGGQNAAAINAIASSLASKPECLNYVKGIEAISDFSEKSYAELGSGGSMLNHITPSIVKSAEKLAKEFAGVPEIEEMFTQLSLRTCGQ